MSKRSFRKISDSTDIYVKKLHEYNISRIIEGIIIEHQDKNPIDDIQVFEWVGVLPDFSKDHDIRKKKIEFKEKPLIEKYGKKISLEDLLKPSKKWSIGIFAFSLGEEQSHYITLILDNSNKIVYVFDSASKNPSIEKNETTYMIGALYPKYQIKSFNICSGCGEYQPAAGAGDHTSLIGQNIFCHTWSLFFVECIISRGIDNIENTIKLINESCSSREENLAMIKRYARIITLEYLGAKLPDDFNYIWKKGKTPSNIDDIAKRVSKKKRRTSKINSNEKKLRPKVNDKYQSKLLYKQK